MGRIYGLSYSPYFLILQFNLFFTYRNDVITELQNDRMSNARDGVYYRDALHRGACIENDKMIAKIYIYTFVIYI